MNPGDRSQVSVVIPTRDRWALLERRALRAALSQRDVSVEVVVVDDGSQSAPPALPEAVRLVRQPGRGVAAARNAGLEAARGAWVAFLDDDDVWPPDRLRRMLDRLLSEGADFGHSSALLLDDDLRPLWVVPATPGPELLTALLRHNAIPAGASNVVVRAELARSVGGFDETFSVAADWDMWIRLALAGTPAGVPEPLVGYVRHPGNWVLTSDPAVTGDVERLEEKHRALMAERGVSVDWLNHDRYVAGSLEIAGRRRVAARRYLAAGLRHRHLPTAARAAATLLAPPPRVRARWRRLAPETPAWLVAYGPREDRPGR